MFDNAHILPMTFKQNFQVCLAMLTGRCRAPREVWWLQSWVTSGRASLGHRSPLARY